MEIPNNIQEESGILNFYNTELHEPLEVSKECEVPYGDEVET